MEINGETKIIARLTNKYSPRGLNIYNPYFQEVGVNAAFILFWDEDPRRLVEGIKDLKFAGAVTVGFEKDADFPDLLDDLDISAQGHRRVGFIKNINGKFVGYNQGGDALVYTVNKAMKVKNKQVLIVGAGNLTRKFLASLERRNEMPKSIQVINRTFPKAKELGKEYKSVHAIEKVSEIVDGDILINISDIGGKAEDSFFTKDIVNRFSSVVDVTFEKEDTNLILLAKKLGKNYATGWDMFTHQGKIVLETILDIKVDTDLLKKHVINGLSEVVK